MIKVIEENHYYPFGLKHTKYNTDWNLFERKGDGNVELRPGRPTAPLEYKYKYNGKEWQDELGLICMIMVLGIMMLRLGDGWILTRWRRILVTYHCGQ